MDLVTRQRLLELNHAFYATVAEPFHQTRLSWPVGKLELLKFVPSGDADRPVHVADIGCGNGRFARMLDSRGAPTNYTGVDAEAKLLKLARTHTTDLQHTLVHFVQADIVQPGWTHVLGKQLSAFDMMVCLATLQHIPSFELRQQVMRELAVAVAPTGVVAVSTWQFLSSERFISRQIRWDAVGLDAGDMEPGDALLPWKRETFAVRYVHQVDAQEMERLAKGADLAIKHMYRADGKEGNLNLYAIMMRT